MSFLKGFFSNTIAINTIVAILLGILCIKLNSVAFEKLDNGRNQIHVMFFRRIIKGVIIILAIIFAFTGFKGLDNVYGLLFRSSILLTAVVGIIGKDILQDVFAGLMISIYRPFNIGDRVILKELDKPCVVDDMTMRHVVLKTMDNICYIIPNSSINTKIILNTSYRHGNLRGTYLQFDIAFSADIRMAIHLIREAVKNCPYTVPNNFKNKDLDGYGDVYLMAIKDSSFQLETTIWTENETDNFLAASEVRLAVIELFRANGIEIPYPYLNLIKQNEQKDIIKNSENVGRRNVMIKSDLIKINDYAADMEKCFEKVKQYSVYYMIDNNGLLKLQLITEELLNFAKKLFASAPCEYWLSGNAENVKIHVSIQIESISNIVADELMELSTNNDVTMDMFNHIKYSVYSGLKELGKNKKGKTLWNSKEEKANIDELEKMILINMTDKIYIIAKNDNIHIVARKNMKKNS